MKTLKKTLCLVLAVVMAVGVLVIPANATAFNDFTDKNDIKHEVAVEVLNALGILTGKDNGSFDPTGNLSRNQAAKLVAYAHGGPVMAESYGKTETLFTDVPANGTYTGYINYVVMNGLAEGNGAGKFMPTSSLTGYQLAKMMLVAAGIGVNEDYVGTGWTMKVNNALVRSGLLEGLAGVDLSKAITRDDAAQLLFNAIQYTPNGGGKTYVVYVGNDVLDTYDSLSEAALAMILYNQGVEEGDPTAKIRTDTNLKGSLGDKNYGLDSRYSEDPFKRTTLQYIDSTKTKNNVYTELSFDPDASFTTPTTLAAALKAAGFKSKDTVTVTAYKNGEADTTDSAANFQIDVTSNKALGDHGTLVEVYDTSESAGNLTATVIIVETKVAVLDDTTLTKRNDKTVVSIDGATIETEAFKKGDVVIYTANKDSIIDISLADNYTGKVTASGNGYFRVDGTQTYKSANAQAFTGSNLASATIGTSDGYKYDADTTYTFYTDFYKNVILAKAGEGVKVDTSYIYVVEGASQKYEGAGAGNDILGTAGTGGKPALAGARVIDPETGVVSVVKLGMGTKSDGQYYYLKPNGSVGDYMVGGENDPMAAAKGFYKYAKLADGTIALDLTDTVKTETVKLEKSRADVVSGKYANGSTVAVVTYLSNDNKTTVTTYNGYGQFPQTAKTYSNTDDTKAMVIADGNGIVSKIYVVTTSEANKPAPVAQPVNYAIYAGQGETNAEGQHVVFYVNGARVTYRSDNLKDTNGSALVANNVYNIELDGDKVTKATALDKKEAVEVSLVQTDFFVAGGTTYYFASGCSIFNEAADYTADTLEAKDKVYVFLKSGTTDVAEFIIIAR